MKPPANITLARLADPHSPAEPSVGATPTASGVRSAGFTRRFVGLAVLLLVLGVLVRSSAAEALVRSEYEIKAAFLYKFSAFVEWPPEVVSTNDPAPFTIGILGHDPFGAKLETTLANKTVRGRPLAFRRAAKVEELLDAHCEIIFIAASEKDRLPAILAALKSHPVLTVSDSPGFAENGVMLNLVTSAQSLRFEINQESARLANLKLRSQLLDLALKVWGRSKPPAP